jgi:chromosome segregation ATPase
MTEIEQAEKIVRELEEKQEALIARTKVLAKQRQECSYAAHTGDKAARTKLDKINVEASTHAGEIESVDAALREAAARLNAAHAETDRAADRAAAEQLRDKLKQFKELGEVLDDCFADFRSAAIGQAAPTHQQYRVLCEIALKTAVQQTPFWSQDFPAMAPNQRKSFRDVCNSWVEPIMHRVNALLGEQHKDAA